MLMTYPEEYYNTYWCYHIGPLEDGTDQGVNVISESEILDRYWDYWQYQLKLVNKNPDNFTMRDCIDDWVMVNWAWKVEC